MNQEVNLSEIVGKAGVFVDGDWVESKDQDPNGDVRLIQLADIGDGNFVNKSARFLTSKKAKELNCTFLEQGDLLIARMPDPLGRSCIFPGLDRPCVTVVDVCIVRPDKAKATTDWLKFMINSWDFRNTINKYITGTTRQRISRGNLNKLKFRLPPVQDQTRIANNLSKAESLISQRKESLRLLDELLKSTFLDMFGSDFAKEGKWKIILFGEVIKDLSDYHANGSYESLKEVVVLKKEVDFALMVRTTDLENNSFSEDCNYIDERAYKYLTKSKIFGGEIIINKIGSAGKVYLMPYLNRPVSLGMNAFLLRFTEAVNNIYVYYLLTSKYGADSISRHVKGAVTKTITKDAVRSIAIPLPPLKLQTQFAHIVEKTEALKAHYQASLRELENLYGALSQRAFRRGGSVLNSPA